MKNHFKSIISKKHYLLNRYSIFIINGFALAASLFFFMQDKYEANVIQALAQSVKSKYGSYNSEDSLIVGSLNVTHFIEERRKKVFEGEQVNDGFADWLRPVSNDLMTADGACGSYSMVLGSILKDLGFDIRFAQMKVDGKFGGHITIEARTKKGWVALDPLYNLYFVKPNGAIASYADVAANWEYYKKQVPENYYAGYNYEGVQYTNWNKVPFVMPAAKGLLIMTMGKKKADEVSLRSFFLRKFYILFIITFSVYIFSCYKIIKRRLSKRKPKMVIEKAPGREAVILNVHLPQLA